MCSIDDFDRVDLHKRYTELLKSYEEVIKARYDDKKAFEQQISAMRMIVGSEVQRPRPGSTVHSSFHTWHMDFKTSISKHLIPAEVKEPVLWADERA